MESASIVEDDVDETVSLPSVLSAGDGEIREDIVEKEVQDDSEEEVPITFSSISSSKASSRKDRGDGASSGGFEQVLLLMAENAANQTRLIVGETRTSSIPCKYRSISSLLLRVILGV